MTEARISSPPLTSADAQVTIQEQRSTRRVEKLYQESSTLPPDQLHQVSAFIEAATQQTHSVEKRILDQLAIEDEQVDELIQQSQHCHTLLKEAAQVIKESGELPLQLEAQLAVLLPHFDTYQQELWRTVQQGQFAEDVTEALERLAATLIAPDTLWSMVLRLEKLPLGVIEKELENGEKVSYLEEVSFWIELQNVIMGLDAVLATERNKKQRRLLRVKAFKEILRGREHLISASFLEDLVEERYDETDPWITGNIFDSFLSIEEEAKKTEQKLSPTQRRLMMVMLGVLMGILITVSGGEDLHSQLQETFSHLRLGAQSQEYTPPQTEEGSTTEEEAAEEESEKAPSSPPPLENRSVPENSGEFPEGSVWQIEGEVPDGYLREATATQWYTNNVWGVESGYGSSLYLPRTSDRAVSHFLSDFTVSGPTRFALPAPYQGYEVVSVDLGEGDYFVRLDPQGTYVIDVRSIEAPTQARIGFGRADTAVTDLPEEEDSNERALIQSMDQLPTEVQELMDGIENYPIPERVNRVTNFVRNYFTYSLNPEYTRYHLDNSGPGVYIQRVFDLPYGDCDVVNTVQVALLRAAGVPARMAYGYMNSSSLLGNEGNSVDRAERHGWAEYYYNGEWLPADATPSQVDDYTRERLEGLNGGQGIEAVIDLSNLVEILKMQLLDIKDWFRVYGFSTVTLSILATWIASLVLINRSNKRQDRRREKIVNEINMSRRQNAATVQDRNLTYYMVERGLNIPKLGERGNFNFALFLFEHITVLPVLLINRLNHHRLTQAEKKIEETDLKSFREFQYTELITQLMDIPSADVRSRILSANNELHGPCTHFYNKLGTSAYEKLQVDFHFQPASFKYANDAETIAALAEKSSSQAEFLNTITMQYYEAFLRALRKRNKQKPDELIPEVSLSTFAEALADPFADLSIIYERIKTMQRLKEVYKQHEAEDAQEKAQQK